jgi:transcription antitermination factor NusG
MSINKLQTGWQVIYTKPRHEKKVRDQLAKNGLTVFLPMIKSLRSWADRKKYVDLPLFPSYLFVKLNDKQEYCRSMSLDGMLYYLRSGKEFAEVSDTVINNIRILLNHGEHLEVSHQRFQPGTLLAVKEGPFAGFTCEVIRYMGRENILVRIELLQRCLLLNLSVESLFCDPFVTGQVELSSH